MAERQDASRPPDDVCIVPLAAVLGDRLNLTDLRLLCLLGLAPRPKDWLRRSQVEIARQLN